MLKHTLLTTAFILTTSAAFAADVVVEKSWTRASLSKGVKSAAAYMTIRNEAPEPDVLLSIEGDVSNVVEVHEMTFKDGVMNMRAMPELHIPAEKEVYLKPGGYHVMLMGLKKPLYEGQQFDLTLNFKNAGAVPVTVNVLEPYRKKGGRE